MMPAYMTATKRRLLDSDDSARIVNADSSAWISETSVIAGSRNRLRAGTSVLPENAIWSRSSSIAGSNVTPSRKPSAGTSLPTMYSTRVSGFER